MIMGKDIDFKWDDASNLPEAVTHKAKIFWNSMLPQITVTDELENKVIECPDGWQRVQGKDNALGMQLPGTPLYVSQEFAEADGRYIWDLYFHLPDGADFRSIQVDVKFPLPSRKDSSDVNYSWMCWAPGPDLPIELGWVGRRTFSYDHIGDHISIPMITLYDEENDLGITYYKPFEVKAPAMDYRITNIRDFTIENGQDLTVETRHLAVTPEKPAHVSIGIFSHEGDWRPALGHMVQAYPDYFNCHLDAPSGSDGPMICGAFDSRIPFSESTVKRLRTLDFTWEEVHTYFPFYGCYDPDADEWDGLLKLEQPDGTMLVNRKIIHDRIGILKRAGVKAYLYWQPGECYAPFAEEHFPDSIIRDMNGSADEAWMHCLFMNYDINGPWGKYILNQAVCLLDEYPEADGLFVDNLVYRLCDFTSSDGVTAWKNRPCYKITFAYDELMTELRRILNDRGKGLMCNGALSIELSRFVDGIMAETFSKLLGYLQYLSVNKPLVLLDYNITEPSMWPCMMTGAFPALNLPPSEGCANNGGLSFEEKERLFKTYLPLLLPLKGRRWVLSPHPLTLPGGVNGNIFVLPDGNYAVTLIPVSSGVKSIGGMRDFDVVLRLDARVSKELKYAVALHADTRSISELPVCLKSDGLHVKVDHHLTATTIVVGRQPIETGQWTQFWSEL